MVQTGPRRIKQCSIFPKIRPIRQTLLQPWKIPKSFLVHIKSLQHNKKMFLEKQIRINSRTKYKILRVENIVKYGKG